MKVKRIIENSVLKPTYMLTYESATELLYMNLEEEEELRILQEAASIRAQWRHSQVCAKSAFLLIYNASLHKSGFRRLESSRCPQYFQMSPPGLR